MFIDSFITSFECLRVYLVTDRSVRRRRGGGEGAGVGLRGEQFYKRLNFELRGVEI